MEQPAGVGHRMMHAKSHLQHRRYRYPIYVDAYQLREEALKDVYQKPIHPVCIAFIFLSD
jgi:hypothetical protein